MAEKYEQILQVLYGHEDEQVAHIENEGNAARTWLQELVKNGAQKLKLLPRDASLQNQGAPQRPKQAAKKAAPSRKGRGKRPPPTSLETVMEEDEQEEEAKNAEGKPEAEELEKRIQDVSVKHEEAEPENEPRKGRSRANTRAKPAAAELSLPPARATRSRVAAKTATLAESFPSPPKTRKTRAKKAKVAETEAHGSQADLPKTSPSSLAPQAEGSPAQMPKQQQPVQSEGEETSAQPLNPSAVSDGDQGSAAPQTAPLEIAASQPSSPAVQKSKPSRMGTTERNLDDSGASLQSEGSLEVAEVLAQAGDVQPIADNVKEERENRGSECAIPQHDPSERGDAGNSPEDQFEDCKPEEPSSSPSAHPQASKERRSRVYSAAKTRSGMSKSLTSKNSQEDVRDHTMNQPILQDGLVDGQMTTPLAADSLESQAGASGGVQGGKSLNPLIPGSLSRVQSAPQHLTSSEKAVEFSGAEDSGLAKDLALTEHTAEQSTPSPSNTVESGGEESPGRPHSPQKEHLQDTAKRLSKAASAGHGPKSLQKAGQEPSKQGIGGLGSTDGANTSEPADTVESPAHLGAEDLHSASPDRAAPGEDDSTAEVPQPPQREDPPQKVLPPERQTSAANHPAVGQSGTDTVSMQSQTETARAEKQRPPEAPVQSTTNTAQGPNLVTAHRSFIQPKQQTQTAFAAAKKAAEVDSVKAAEAAKRKEAAREAARQKQKEELKKQKAERAKHALQVKANHEEATRKAEEECRKREETAKRKEEEAAARRRAREEAERQEKEEKQRRLEEAKLRKKQEELRKQEQASSKRAREAESKHPARAPLQESNEAKRPKVADFFAKAAAALIAPPKPAVPAAGPPPVTQTDSQKPGGQGSSTIGSGTADAKQPFGLLAPVPEGIESIEIAPYRSEGETSDEDDDQEIPLWAQGGNLRRQIVAQQRMDPDELFQQHEKTCPLNEVFDTIRGQDTTRDLSRRTSTGNWLEDRVTWKEELNYKKAMGYL